MSRRIGERPRDWLAFLDAEIERAFYATFFVTQREIAEWRGVTTPMIHCIITGKTNDGRLWGVPWRRPERRR